MSDFIDNHILEFPTLIGGIAIANPNNGKGETGTLGCIATRDGVDRRCISCFHVLCRVGAPMPVAVEELIVQSLCENVSVVGEVSAERGDRFLDCAAALIRLSPTVGRILGIGKLTKESAPAVGMRVLKSGAATGVTEGIITSIESGQVLIECEALPANYALTKPGDSGGSLG